MSGRETNEHFDIFVPIKKIQNLLFHTIYTKWTTSSFKNYF